MTDNFFNIDSAGISTGKSSSISNNTLMMGILNKLEGYKTKLKELHWAAKRFPNSQHSLHIEIDNFIDEVSDYEDAIAEVGQSFMGPIEIGTLVATPCRATDVFGVVAAIKADISSLKMAYKDNMEWTGIMNATDDFFQQLQNRLYLFQICQGNI